MAMRSQALVPTEPNFYVVISVHLKPSVLRKWPNWLLSISLEVKYLFEVLEKTLESPLDSKEIKTVNPKRNKPEYSLEGLMLKLKLQYFGHLMWRPDSYCKDSDAGKDWGQKKGTTEDEMVGWHHQLNRHESEQILGESEGQGSLVCYIQSMGLQRVSQGLREWTTNGKQSCFTSDN